ncbi:MAG: hypothetical protein FWG14_13490 [Peptococcaceae bacterium]|nr:hypothetical protein [Peptococcaceae bacterium]
MKTPNTIEQEINQIRLRIYEETKDMTVEERVERINRIGENASKKYGFKIVASTKDPDYMRTSKV